MTTTVNIYSDPERKSSINIPRISDGVIFRVLRNLLVLEGERLSYRTLDVEQIGSVYEAIMGFEIEVAEGKSIALKPIKSHGAPATINLEALLEAKPANRAKLIKEATDQKIDGAALKALKSAESIDELLEALDKKIAKHVTPGVVPSGSIVFQPSDERSSLWFSLHTSVLDRTHRPPPPSNPSSTNSAAKPPNHRPTQMVSLPFSNSPSRSGGSDAQAAGEGSSSSTPSTPSPPGSLPPNSLPPIYAPTKDDKRRYTKGEIEARIKASERRREYWQAAYKVGTPHPAQILDLKICDPAMGSGAFLVEACRQLADHLVEAWHAHSDADNPLVSKPYPLPAIPADEDEVLYARRLVAQRCLYGVDKNVMAVDLAKLSLWLVTLARDHAFTFLDHSLSSRRFAGGSDA